MKVKNIKQFAVVLLMTLCGSVFAQQTNTLYFMKGVPERAGYNPAFQPDYNFWIDIPVLPNLNLNLDFGKNSFTYDSWFPNNKFFLDADAKEYRDKFYKNLKPTTKMNIDFAVDMLAFGFRTGKSYWNVNTTLKASGNIFLPKGLFELPLLKFDENAVYNLSSLGVDVSAYTEIGLGWSYKINDRLNVGVKGKFLLGHLNFSSDIKNLKITTDRQLWTVEAEGRIQATIPETLINIPNWNAGQDIDGKSFDNVESLLKDAKASEITKGLINGSGLGVDLGVSWEAVKNLTFSAAVTDLGFIRWKNAKQVVAKPFDFSYEGVLTDIDIDKETIKDKYKEIGDNFLDNMKGQMSDDKYTTKLHTRVNVGAEYAMFNDKLGVGLLYSGMFVNKSAFNELTASVNWRPCRWFNPALTYSILDNKFNTLGAGLQMKFGPWVTYVAIDQIPVGSKVLTKQYIPKNMMGTNIQAGVILAFNGPRDDDKDGVKNRKDRCPNTPFGVIVDIQGCPIDTDGDGVPDYLDQCPNTPSGVQVDVNGCPFDTDGDGVPDYLDQCPNTPVEAYSTIDERGCPIDTDGDGVPDYLDQCPNTPAGVEVDVNGCPFDTDGDGVADYLDQCPNTPAGIQVDTTGCPIDSDGDGIPDYLDQCPYVFGIAENNGCPEVKAAIKQLFKKALKGIQFDTGKATIKKVSNPILNDIAKAMLENPDYFLVISGHTDNVGKPEANQILSENRAAAVRAYLIGKGVAENRLTSFGFGDTQPVDTNKTSAGRSNNRRVDFEVRFEAFEDPAAKVQ